MIKTKFETSDGKLFDSYKMAENHEQGLQRKKLDAYNRYINGYAVKQLFKKHTLDEVGLWEVTGEDPNCDLGGPHSNPYLFTANGKLDDVIREAVNTPGFWQWGAGGEIRKIDIKEL